MVHLSVCWSSRPGGGAAPKASSSSLSGDSGDMDEAELFGGMDIDESKPLPMQVCAVASVAQHIMSQQLQCHAATTHAWKACPKARARLPRDTHMASLSSCCGTVHLQGEEREEFNEVAEILLQLQDNLTVNPRKRYTTRTVTGMQCGALQQRTALHAAPGDACVSICMLHLPACLLSFTLTLLVTAWLTLSCHRHPGCQPQV